MESVLSNVLSIEQAIQHIHNLIPKSYYALVMNDGTASAPSAAVVWRRAFTQTYRCLFVFGDVYSDLRMEVLQHLKPYRFEDFVKAKLDSDDLAFIHVQSTSIAMHIESYSFLSEHLPSELMRRIDKLVPERLEEIRSEQA